MVGSKKFNKQFKQKRSKKTGRFVKHKKSKAGHTARKRRR